MERINMKYDRLIEILDVCDLEELDSFDMLLSYIKKFDLTTTNRAYNKIYSKKRNQERENLEGMNEYDAITKTANFDVTELPEYATNSYELIYFKKLMTDAVENIKKDLEETKLEEDKAKIELELRKLPNIEKSLIKTCNYLKMYTDIENIATEKDLEILFNKFSITEIEAFDDIFEYMGDYNVEMLLDVSNKVRNNKIDEAQKEYEVSVKPYNFDVLKLAGKKKELTSFELEFLCTILDDAIPGLMCYKEEYNKRSDEYYIKLEASLLELHLAYSEELNKRKGKVYKKTR